MLKNVKRLAVLFVVALPISAHAASDTSGVELLKLENKSIMVEVTPDIGGRILHFSRQGAPNFLRVGKEVKDIPDPVVDANASNIGYLGHEMWVGPQSAWWTEQSLNTARLKEKAMWPPDPYLVLSSYKVTESDDRQVVLQGPSSPISGVAFTKTYRLLKDSPDSLQLDVTARNTRKSAVSWDIWFNTRVRAEAKVYVPIKNKESLKVNPFPGDDVAPPVYRVKDNLFTFDLVPPPTGKTVRRGKAFMQPADGWMAAFDHGQVFIVQFELQPASLIHPEQGQVELYLDYQPGKPEAGLLEMEVHAPYRTLAPGEAMHAQERWTILTYDGDFTHEGHLQFLRRHSAGLGLRGL